MMIDPPLIEAARETIRRRGFEADLLEIDGCEGMFVAESDNDQIMAIHFFSEGGKRFAIGVKRK